MAEVKNRSEAESQRGHGFDETLLVVVSPTQIAEAVGMASPQVAGTEEIVACPEETVEGHIRADQK